MAGASLEAVLDVATGRDFTGARSVAAVMHGRVETAGLGRQEAGRETASGSPGQSVCPRWSRRRPARSE